MIIRQAGTDVDEGHDRHHLLRPNADPLDAAEHDECEDHGNCCRRAEARHAEGTFHRIHKGGDIGQMQAEGSRKQRHRAEEHGQPFQPQAFADVIGRSAAKLLTVAAAHLIDLCQGTLNERRCSADQSHDPHPENRARAAKGNGSRHTGNVSGSYPSGSRNHKRLDRGNTGFAFFTVNHDPEHVFDFPELHGPGRHSEEDAGTQNQKHHGNAPDQVVQFGCELQHSHPPNTSRLSV